MLQNMSRGPQRVVIVTGAVTAVLLAVLAYALVMSGRNSREDLERSVDQRATLSAALIDSLLTQTVGSFAESDSGYAARSIDPQDLRGDSGTIDQKTVVLDARGKVLAAWPPRSDTPTAVRAMRPAARAVTGGRDWTIELADDHSVNIVVGIDTPYGRRAVVNSFGAGLLQMFFGQYLERVRAGEEDEAYLTDSRGRVISEAKPDGKHEAPAFPAGKRGSLDAHGAEHYYSSAAITGLDWRVVVSVPKAQLYAPVGGVSSWLSWGLFVAFSILAGLAIVLVHRLARNSARLAHANAELEIRNEQVVMADRTKSDFLASMSHELRTPLNGIIGFAELMHDGRVGPVSDQHREYLGDILSSSNHLRRLIDDVLDLSKIEAGKIDLRPERVECAKVVGEVCDVVQSLAVRKRIELTCDVDPDIGPLDLDPGKLKQVLFNYVSNALKFTPEDGHVSVRATAEPDDRFRIVVEDDGPGISDEDLERLWSAFEQLETGSSRRYGGTGLGLSLTRRIVEAQGGEVGVESTVGQGTRFHVVLPCNASETSASDHTLVLQ